MKNLQSHPIRSKPFTEVNTILTQTHGRGRGCGHGHGHVCILQL